MTFQKLLIFSGKLFKVFSLILILVLTLYGSQYFFPTESYKNKLRSAFNYGLLDNNVTERTPTGWGSDKATECLSLGIGLSSAENPSQLLMNYHPNSIGTYNPCQGLKSWAFNETNKYEFLGYARYWHGHSDLIRWLVFLFGIPIARSILWMIFFLLLIKVADNLRKSLKEYSCKPGTWSVLTIGTYVFLAGVPDLHSSMTHLLSEISILLIVIASFTYLENRSTERIALLGFAMGGLYVVTSYMINPQSIPAAVLVWSTIPLILKTRKSAPVLKKTFILLSSLITGFVSLWVSKWLLISALTNYKIGEEVRNQALHRASQSASSLSDGVARHLESFQHLPAFLQAILANVATLFSKIYDPRYSNPFSIGISLGMLGCLIVQLIRMEKSQNIVNSKHRLNLRTISFGIWSAWLLSLFSVLFWYVFLTQHSFDHATYTFRSLGIVLSGLPLALATSFWNKVQENEL